MNVSLATPMDLRSLKIMRCIKVIVVVEMGAERRDNGLGLGGVITAHGGEDGTVIG
jgi:hypothetical protein